MKPNIQSRFHRIAVALAGPLLLAAWTPAHGDYRELKGGAVSNLVARTSAQQARFFQVKSAWVIHYSEQTIDGTSTARSRPDYSARWTWSRIGEKEHAGVRFDLPIEGRDPQCMDLDSFFDGSKLTLHYPLTRQVVILEQNAFRCYWPTPADFLLPNRVALDTLAANGACITGVASADTAILTAKIGIPFEERSFRTFKVTVDCARDDVVVAWEDLGSHASCTIEWQHDNQTGKYSPSGARLSVQGGGTLKSYELQPVSYEFGIKDEQLAHFKPEPRMLVADYCQDKPGIDPASEPKIYKISEDGTPSEVAIVETPTPLSSYGRISIWSCALLGSALLIALRMRIMSSQL